MDTSTPTVDGHVIVPPSSSSPETAARRPQRQTEECKGPAASSTLDVLQKVSRAGNKREREVDGGITAENPGFKIETISLPPTVQTQDVNGSSILGHTIREDRDQIAGEVDFNKFLPDQDKQSTSQAAPGRIDNSKQ